MTVNRYNWECPHCGHELNHRCESFEQREKIAEDVPGYESSDEVKLMNIWYELENWLQDMQTIKQRWWRSGEYNTGARDAYKTAWKKMRELEASE